MGVPHWVIDTNDLQSLAYPVEGDGLLSLLKQPRVYTVLALGVFAGLFLAACGGGDSVVYTPTPTFAAVRTFATPTSAPTPSPTPTPEGARLSGSANVFLASDEYHQIPVDLKAGDVLNVRFDISASSIANPDQVTDFARAGAAVIMAIIDPSGANINISQTGTGYTEAFTISTGETARVVIETDGRHFIGFFNPLKLRVLAVVVNYSVNSQ